MRYQRDNEYLLLEILRLLDLGNKALNEARLLATDLKDERLERLIMYLELMFEDDGEEVKGNDGGGNRGN